MDKNNNSNVISLGNKFTEEDDYDIEEVPYLNNESDDVQDIIKEVQNHTKDLEKDIIKQSNNSTVKIDFNKNANK